MKLLPAAGFAVIFVICLLIPIVTALETEDSSAPESEATKDPKKLKNPVLYTRKNVVRGKNVFLRYCVECHDRDGRSLTNVEEQATDLTRPQIWQYGTTDGEVFTTLKKGGGDVMPPYESLLKDQDIWCIVNFLKSIGPKDKRPKYIEVEKKTVEKE